MHATETSLHGEQQWPEISTHTEKRESSEIDFSSSKRHDLFAVLPDGAKEGLSLLSQPPPRAVLSWKLLGSHTHFGAAAVCCSSETWGKWFKQRGFFPPPIQQAQHTGIEGPYTWKGEGSTSAAGSRITSVSHRSWVCREMEAQARKHLVEGGKQPCMALSFGLLGEWRNGTWGFSSCCAHGTELHLSCPSAAVVWPWGWVQTLPTNQCLCL